MQTALWGFHMAHPAARHSLGLYLAMGGVLALSQTVHWGVVPKPRASLFLLWKCILENFTKTFCLVYLSILILILTQVTATLHRHVMTNSYVFCFSNFAHHILLFLCVTNYYYRETMTTI